MAQSLIADGMRRPVSGRDAGVRFQFMVLKAHIKKETGMKKVRPNRAGVVVLRKMCYRFAPDYVTARF
jgi:hypothetical protein